MNSIPSIISKHKAYFAAGHTRPLESRLNILRKLKQAVRTHEADLIAALYQDLHKSEQEAYSTEIGIVLEEISFVMKRLRKWSKPKRVKTPLTHLGSKSIIIPEPYGTVLVIAPWNYPLQLALSPLIGAIAAGNTVVLKPSEYTPAVSAALSKLISSVFPTDYVAMAEGGPDVSTALLQQPFDYIFFTGSVAVGKIVMEAAAKQLIPVTLELGGKSPCIVHKDADIQLAAKRIVFGKFTNAGQTCIAPDYLFVHEDIKTKLTEEMKRAIREFYGPQPERNPQYGKVVSERHYQRLLSFLNDGIPLTGGQSNPNHHKIAPTILEQVRDDSPVMQEEIFGPILPLFTYRDIGEVIEKVQSRPKPLALYLFTTNQEIERAVLGNLSFGGGCVNDTLMHVATPYLPFGGVGESGIGSYHGFDSFNTFTHKKSVVKQTNRFDFAFRYPSSKNGLRMIRKILK
ncbi:aldehyde dehydrogenase [Bacillus subtilis]|jgi:aldehyde dehydrogenase (NAD+)|uniref:aldehyde dehydrogenase n=1 Tax=Bacillus subtilis TaxID=1423 RepID=UPI0004A57063|nr:aldehyde dehydrogenase [Bacillus subtilis]RPK13713.1 Aldehyde dehydrogenase [Bacillus subtilis]UQZ55320.1 aldehyde dehydrogenase [Bacillus subtilis]UQZ66305.1 aldehyde dehydrogenase [Bacillus subtilis PY79]UQZ70723.1 aldehyde dehydrogenase [Bacillus subtilis]CCU57150.1 Aldehyde dehydrogenase [Bacillus subtilis E1]